MKLILASGSPRRKDLLRAVGINIYKVAPANIPEMRGEEETPLAYCQRLAREKSTTNYFDDALILAADTIVAKGDEVFEKPHHDAHALQTLLSLQDCWHEVITAWALFDTSTQQLHQGHAISKVRFRPLSQAECQSYIATGEGNDKAGAYGIQGLGSALIETIQGSYSNIVGLPMEQIVPLLHKLQSK